jgi:transcriptional regulator with XRE-family HTH domain
MSQEQLAERAETHWTYVSGIERGRHNPGLNMLGRLAHALDLPLSGLLDGVGDLPKRRRDSRAR